MDSIKIIYDTKSVKVNKLKIILEDGFAIQKGAGIGQYTLNLLGELRQLPEIDSIQVMEKPLLSMVPSPALRRVLYCLA